MTESSDPSQDAEIVGDVEYDSIRDEWRPAGSSDLYYPDCQPVPHNPLDCRGYGPEDHDPAYSKVQEPKHG